MTTAILIDPHLLVRKAIMTMVQNQLSVRFLADVGDGVAGLAAFQKYSPDVVITETLLPHGRGIELIRSLKEFKGKVIALSMQADDVYVVEALKAGALAYVLKQGPCEDLSAAITAVGKGEPFLSHELRSCAIRVSLNRSLKPGDGYARLTTRERSVMQLAADGLSCNEIASHLFVSRRTAESHRARMMNKLGLKSQTDLVKSAVRHGIIAL